jgi:uncharacterized membrane protein YfcA
MAEYIFVSTVLFLASFTFGAAGFGIALVSVPLLSLSLAPRFVVPFILVYAYGINLFLLSRFRSHVQWPRVWPLMLGAAPGIPIGIYFLKTSEALIVRNAVGVIIILFALWSLFVRGQKTYNISRPWAFATGFASGIISSAFAMPGPPVLIYLALNRWEKNLTRATLQFYFFFTGTCSLLGQVLAKVLTLQVLKLNLLYLPVVIVGGSIGYLTFKRLSSQVFNKVLLYVLLAVGLFLVFS